MKESHFTALDNPACYCSADHGQDESAPLIDGIIHQQQPVINLRRLFVGSVAFLILFVYYTAGGGSSGQAIKLVPAFELQKCWAQYSPYFPVGDYVGPPKGCQVIQANILQRHGARYPTSGASIAIVAALKKLQSVTNYTDPGLEFLKTYKYNLGTDDLVSFGAQEALDAGKNHFIRYSHLVSQQQLPFVRASGSDRVVFSATNWTEGFAIASRHMYRPKLALILLEHLNDTLDDHMCPSAGDSDEQTTEWLSLYGPPIAARLNEQAIGANLTASDVYSLMSLCPFESISTMTLSHSSFCDLFTDSEFEQYEYSGDLDKYYKTGYGQRLGPVQGVGYVNELLARLTGKPVRDNTQTNRTLDASPSTFPLNRTLYADFSHDNQLIAIYAALGLFRERVPPDPSRPDPKRNWLASHLVPFSARMVTEKLRCGAREHVRVFVNDALQLLEFCGAQDDGLCALEDFVESQAYARNDGLGDFEHCFE